MLTMYTSSFLKKVEAAVEANLLNANELLMDDDTFDADVDVIFFVMVHGERRRVTKQKANVRSSFLCLLFLLSHL